MSRNYPFQSDNLKSKLIRDVDTWPFLQFRTLTAPRQGKNQRLATHENWMITKNKECAEAMQRFEENQKLWVTMVLGIVIAIVTGALISLIFGESPKPPNMPLTIDLIAILFLVGVIYYAFIPADLNLSIDVLLTPYQLPPAWQPCGPQCNLVDPTTNLSPIYEEILENLVFIISQCMIRDALSQACLKHFTVIPDRTLGNRKPSTLLSVSLKHKRYFFNPSISDVLQREISSLILELGLMSDRFSVYDLEEDGGKWQVLGPRFLTSYYALNITDLSREIDEQIRSGAWRQDDR